MRHLSALIALMFVAACNNQAPSAREKPNKPLSTFEFRGLKPGTTTFEVGRQSKALQNCELLIGAVQARCEFTKTSIGDVDVSMYQGESYVMFTSGKLSSIDVRFDPSHYAEIKRLLSKTYGTSCFVGPGTDAIGTRLEGEEADWCFKQGRLRLYEHDGGRSGYDRGSMYFDFDIPRSPKPDRTYDANSL